MIMFVDIKKRDWGRQFYSSYIFFRHPVINRKRRKMPIIYSSTNRAVLNKVNTPRWKNLFAFVFSDEPIHK